MKNQTISTFIIVSAIIFLGGCGSKVTDEIPPAAPQASASSGTSDAAIAQKGSTLGSEVVGDHFSVTLTSEPTDLKVGKAKFIVKLLHHGEPTDGATVKLSFSMPSMNMGESEVRLKFTKDGMYEGEAELSMGGDWQAKVSVDQEGHPGEATYDFVVMQ